MIRRFGALSIFFAAIAIMYYYRVDLVLYAVRSAITIAQPTVQVAGVSLDLKENRLVFTGVRLANPAGFSREPCAFIKSAVFSFKPRIRGFEIVSCALDTPRIRIERSRDGRWNVVECLALFAPAQEGPISPSLGGRIAAGALRFFFGEDLANAIPVTVSVVGGSALLVDDGLPDGSHRVSLDAIVCENTLEKQPGLKPVRLVSSSGSALVNDDPEQVVRWKSILDLAAPRLTMSNKIDLRRVDILAFFPYIRGGLPFVFKGGKVSGELIVDFDNGSIGSTNNIWLEDLSFKPVDGLEEFQLFQVSVAQLARYFESVNPGEAALFFDFKIKGDLKKPKFLLGPRTTKVLVSASIEKVASLFLSAGTSSLSNNGMNDVKTMLNRLRSVVSVD